MFVGRSIEKRKIEDFIKYKNSMLLYGVRRVGKTTLIKQALNDSKKNYLYYECEKASEESNVLSFISLINEKFSESYGAYNTFEKIIEQLSRQHPDLIIVIDEYSYVKEYYLTSKKPDSNLKALELDSEFQRIIDNTLENIKLILCGSSISIMSGLLEYSNPLHGRFDLIINLKPFTYLEVKEMFPTLSNQEIVRLYAVFGGSPYVLSKYDTTLSFEENICLKILDRDGDVYRHISYNVLGEFDKDPDLNNILNIIKNSAKKYSDIEQFTNQSSSGLLDKRLKKLLDLNIIEKVYPIGHEGDKRKAFYSLNDNLLKFYYAYVFREENRISLLGGKRYYETYISISLNEYVSRRFENIVKEYFSLMVKKGNYPGIVDIGTYFTSTNEYDCVFKKEDGTYGFYEVKYLKEPLSKGQMLKKINQIQNIKGIKVSEIGFVCTSGFEEKLPNIQYLDLDNIFTIG